MKLVIIPSVICAMLLAAAPEAAADQPNYFGKKPVEQKISFRQAKPRTRRQHIILASLFGGAALFGGVALFFHLDSRDVANELSFAGGEPSRVYDRSVEAVRDRGLRSRTLAIVGYSIAGSLLIATIVAMAITQPGEEIVTVDDEKNTPKVTVPVSIVPVPGGAVIGGAWSF